MNAGETRTLVKLEPSRDAELRIALAIEEGNSQMLAVVVRTQSKTIEQQSLLIKRQQSRSNN